MKVGGGLSEVVVSGAAFAKSYADAAKALGRSLDRFLDAPGEEEVHDARTATRRMEAHLELLPKRRRKSRPASEMAKRLKRVMEESARVRDLDVIRGKLARDGVVEDPLVRRLERERRNLARAAREAVYSARELEVPKLTAKDVRQARLERRFRKASARLVEEIETRVPAVLDDPANQRELHKLRIGLKRLRYTLDSVTARRSAASGKLAAWQDALGSIHDWDVAIAYVDRHAPASTVLPKWAQQRAREFGSLARSLRGPG